MYAVLFLGNSRTFDAISWVYRGRLPSGAGIQMLPVVDHEGKRRSLKSF